MTEAILRIALTDDGGKWEPGTILAAYPPDEQLGAGELAGFHCERITTVSYSLDDLRAMRCLKVLDLSELIEPDVLESKLAQKENIHAFMADSRFTGLPGKMVVVEIGDVHIKPVLDTATDFDSLTLNDCADEFLPKLIEVVPAEARDQLDALNKVRS